MMGLSCWRFFSIKGDFSRGSVLLGGAKYKCASPLRFCVKPSRHVRSRSFLTAVCPFMMLSSHAFVHTLNGIHRRPIRQILVTEIGLHIILFNFEEACAIFRDHLSSSYPYTNSKLLTTARRHPSYHLCNLVFTTLRERRLARLIRPTAEFCMSRMVFRASFCE